MRFAAPSKLAVLIGAIAATGCVEKIVQPGSPLPDAGQTDEDDFDAGNGGNGGLDSSVGTPDAGSKPDAGNVNGQLSCMTYCSENLRVCTDEFTQYMDLQQCLNMCADRDLGAASDASGDTTGCRLYHTNKAEETGSLDVHCAHAGPSGGAICGDRCEVFCKGVTELCTASRAELDADIYASEEECLQDCSEYAVDPDDELPATGNSVNCRLYHLSLAYKAEGVSLDQLQTHCGHTAEITGTGPCSGLP